MDKKNIVWIALRFLGLLYAFQAIAALIRIPVNMCALYAIGTLEGSLIFLILGDRVLRDVFVIIIAAYFLFFGGFAWRIVSNRVENDFAQSSELGFTSLLVRMTGVWCLIRAFSESYRLLRNLFIGWYVSLEAVSLPQELYERIFSTANMTLLQIVIDTIVYFVLAYYLIYRGRIIINFIGKRAAQVSRSSAKPSCPSKL